MSDTKSKKSKKDKRSNSKHRSSRKNKSKLSDKRKKRSSSKKEKKPVKKTDKNVIRFFRQLDIKTYKTIGRYLGRTPKQAASKAFSMKVRMSKSKKGKKLGLKPITKARIYLRESTQNSTKKIFGYKGKLIAVPNPKPRKIKIRDEDGNVIGKKEITNYFKNDVKKLKVSPEIKEGYLRKQEKNKEKKRKEREREKRDEKKKSKSHSSKSKKKHHKKSKSHSHSHSSSKSKSS